MDRWTPTGLRSRTAAASPAAWSTVPRAHRAAAGAGLLLTVVVGVTTVATTLAERPPDRTPAPARPLPAAGVPAPVGAELLRTWGLDLDPETGLVVPAQSRLPALPGLVGGDAAVPAAPGDMSPTVAPVVATP